MTYKPNKLGQIDLDFDLRSEFTNRSVYAESQVSTYSAYDLFHPG